MNTELLKQKIREYFNNISPEELITKFEKMGYSFVDVTEQSEPLPDSGGLTKEEILYKHSSNSMTRYPNQIRTEVLAAMEEYKNQELAATSTISEAGEDAIGFAEWKDLYFMGSYDKKFTLKHYTDIKIRVGLLFGEHYTTEQLYQLYKSKQ